MSVAVQPQTAPSPTPPPDAASWTPTDQFLHGRLWKPFLPFDKHPSLRNDNFKNLYAGDEVYIFETKGNRWARGYTLTRPFPNDFTITSVNLDDLPGLNISVAVFPLSYIKVIETLPLNLIELSPFHDNFQVRYGELAPTLKDTERSYQEAVNGADGVPQGSRAVIPPLPFNSFTFAENLVSEITYAMNLLTSHIFALYSIGEFRLFNTLSQVYRGLDETRVKLTHNLLTEKEVHTAEETATLLLNTIPKKLASRQARMNVSAYDLDNKYTDISGYKAVLARDTFNGTLLSLDNARPAHLALNQQLCALAPKYPVNAHYKPEDYVLKPQPNKNLVHDPPLHILVDFKSVSGSSAFQPAGFAGMIAYLYIRNSKKRLTEAFAVHTNSVNELVLVEKISAALFRNIPASEIENKRVYMVAMLTEEIDLDLKDQSKPHITRVKKGVACGVADITRIFSRNHGALASGKSHQFSIRLFGSFMQKKTTHTDKMENHGWGEIADRIINSATDGIATNPRAEKLVITIKEFKHQLTEVAESRIDRIAAPGAPKESRNDPIAKIKPIFFDPLAENYERVYLNIGRILMLDKTKRESLLTIEVSAPTDPNVTFAKASNQFEKESWQFVSVHPNEAVGEIVKINGITKKGIVKLAHKQDTVLVALFVDGVFAGRAEFVYRSGNRIVEFKEKKFHLLDIYPSSGKAPIAQVEFHTEYIGKFFNIKPCIEDIFQCDRLLNASQTGIDELNNALVEFCKLDLYDMVRFFPELLTSIFRMVDICISRFSAQIYSLLLDVGFKAIVHLLDTIFGKQDQYLYMFDTYVQESAISPRVGVFLMEKMTELLSRALVNWTSLSRAVCRNLALLVAVSLAPPEKSHRSEAYVEALTMLFKAASSFVALEQPALISDQILVMEFPDFVLAHERQLKHAHLLQMVLDFIDSIGTRGLGIDTEALAGKKPLAAKDHKIIITKLLLIQRLYARELSQNLETMHLLISKSVNWAMEIFVGDLDVEATRLAVPIMKYACDLLHANLHHDLVKPICYSLTKHLVALSRTFIKYNKFTRGADYFRPAKNLTQLFQKEYPFKTIICDPAVGEEVVVEVLVELATVFVCVSKIGTKTAGAGGFEFINNVPIENDFYNPQMCSSNKGIHEDILTILAGIQLIRQGKFFPEDKWLSLYAVMAEGCLGALELVRPLMTKYFIPPMDTPDLFDRSLLGSYMKTLLRLATLAPVAVEHLSTIPRKACFQITGRMRDKIAEMIDEIWDALAWDASPDDQKRFHLARFGGYQVEFISSDYTLLQDLMLFALQRNAACQNVSVKIIWSVLIAEYILSDSIVDVEKECMTGLNQIFVRPAYKPDLNEQLTFIERLKSTIRLDREDEVYPIIVNFIKNIEGFLEVLSDLTNVPVGPEFDDDRTLHKLNINAYLKNANKPELFNLFINLMFEENVKKGDYIQAALSLEMLASTYTWDHYTLLPASYKPKFPEQSSFERKEALVKMIAQNFIKGNSLERATDTYNELLDAYSEYTYDLKSFAYVHQKLAKLFLELESSDKLSPSFFRVAYIGAGFPATIRGKEQIYEGLPFEHITSIHERLLKMYPGARIITDDSRAIELKKKVQTGRYLHVNAVEPVNEVSDKILNTSIGVRQYARNKNLRFFSTTKKIPGSTSVFDLWTEEVTYETFSSFPTLMNRSEIKNTSVMRLSPLDNAVRTILSKNNEMVQLESLINMAVRDKVDYGSLVNDLSRQLAGTVDSPVNGGVGQYRTFFVDPRYEGKPEFEYSMRLLKNAFNDLTLVLSKCLHLHSKLVPASMRPSHLALVDFFKQNFKTEIEALQINTNYRAQPYNHSVTVLQATKEKKSTTAGNGSINGTLMSDQGLTVGLGSLLRITSRPSSLGNSVSNTSDAATSLSFGSLKRTAINWRKQIA